MKHYLKSVLLLLLLATTMVACMQEEIDTEGVSGNNDPEVTFTFELPAQAKPTTRATVGENSVENVYVLAFDKDSEFSYYRMVTTIGDVNNGDNTKPKKEFKVSLKKSADANDKYSFVLIANVKDGTKAQIKALAEGTAMATALAGLTYTATSNVTPTIPMASLPTTAVEINNSTPAFSNISLTRMAARIDVSVSSVANYRVAKVYLYDYNTCGWVYAPESAFTKSSTTYPHVQTPTINKSTERGFVQGADDPISVSNGTDKTVINFANKLYTFEAVNADNSPRLVVELEKTTDEGTTYSSCGHYKLTFAKEVSGSVTPLDILRNYCYIFNITSVNSEGFNTPKEAYESVITGIEANVINWSSTEVPVVATDGNGLILAVNQMAFEFGKEEAKSPSDVASQLKIYTNNASGWEIKNLKVYDGDGYEIVNPAQQWFNPSVTAGLKNNEGEHTKVFLQRLKENTMGNSRKATFNVVAGNIKLSMTVTQTTKTKGGTGGGGGSYGNAYWAGSNIYWDDEKQHLTFDVDPGENYENSKKQGVFFKWGSLVGIAPIGRKNYDNKDWNAAQAQSYYLSNTTEGSMTMAIHQGVSKPIGFSANFEWVNIPYVTNEELYKSRENYLVKLFHDPTKHTGDICKLISDNGWVNGDDEGGSWRVPTMLDYGYESDYTSYLYSAGRTYDLFGTGIINQGILKSVRSCANEEDVFFPNSHFRGDSMGGIIPADDKYTSGYYATSSPYSEYNGAVHLKMSHTFFTNLRIMSNGYTMNANVGSLMTQYYATPIRCVRYVN